MSENFQDILNEIDDLPNESPTEEGGEDSPSETSEGDNSTKDPTQEAQDEPKAEEVTDESETAKESEAEATVEESRTEAEEDKSPEADDDKEADTEADEKESDEVETVTIDGEEVTLEEIRRLKKEERDDGLRQQDYSRKTAALAERTKQLEAVAEDREKLATEISEDPGLAKFLGAHPEALQYLMKRPEATRQLIGDSEGVEQRWEDYEAVKDRPSLAKRLAEGPEPTPEAEEALVESRRENKINAIVGGANQLVDAIAPEFEGIDPNEVRTYLMDLAGFTPEIAQDRAAVEAVSDRMFALLFRSSADGKAEADVTLIRNRFQALADSKKEAEPEVTDTEKHNLEVDKALKEEALPTTPDGVAPSAEGEAPKEYSSFREALDDIDNDD